MPFPNFHAFRLKSPDIFDKDSWKTTKGGTLFAGKLKVPTTINLIWGKLKGKTAPDDPPILQSIRFQKAKWTVASAKAWLSKNIRSKGLFEPAASNNTEAGHNITDKDLDNEVLAGNLTEYNSGSEIDFDPVAIEYCQMDETAMDETAEVAAIMAQLMTDIDAEEAMNETEEEAAAGGKVEDEVVDIEGVEIFATGFWGNERWKAGDLDELVRNFKKLKDEIKPPVKLGHSVQKLLKSEGLPAAGWVTNLRRVGTKLLADLSDVPKRIARIIKNKGYKRVSIEIYRNHQDSRGNRVGQALKALALLGGDIPELKTLKDVEALYANEIYEDVKEVTFMAKELEKKELEEEAEEKTEGSETEETKTEKKETQEKTEESEAEGKTEEKEETQEKTSEGEKETGMDDKAWREIEKLRKLVTEQGEQLTAASNVIATLTSKTEAQEKQLRFKEHSAFLDGIADRFPPAAKDKALALMESLDDTEDSVVTFGEGEADRGTPLAIFKQILSDLPAVMDMEEGAKGQGHNKPGTGPKVPSNIKAGKLPIEGLEFSEQVKQFMADNPDASMEDAMIAVSKETGE